jgi:two-component system, cell cycle sensor histidine kinase and response regulator CckA
VLGLLLFTGASATVFRARVRRGALERGKLEGRLQRAARFEAVGQLAGGVIHDFNNVLTVINGAADELSHNPNDPAQTTALAGAIGRAGEHGAALTQQLLNVVRQRPPALRPSDLNAAVADTAGTLVRLMGERVAVRVTADPHLPPVLADGALVLQIVLNLAVNARDAMPNGGTFTLATAAPAPGVVRLSATDTGTGMSAGVRDRAFDAGFTTKEADKGTGLGLYIVARAVEALGGTVRVRSEPGRGTTFEIDLPAAPTR